MIRNFLQYKSDVKLILITSLLSNVGIFMVIPFLAIYLNKLDTITTSEIGLIIGISFWCQRAGSFFGGLMSDYISTRNTMLLGLIIRVPGYFLVGYVDNFYPLLIACSLIGLGSSIYLPAAKSFLVKIVYEKEKVEILSTRMVFSNIGVATGPVIGMFIFSLSPKILFSSVGIIFIIITFLNLKLRINSEIVKQSSISLKDLNLLFKNKLMISISFLMFLFSACYMQIESTIPVLSSKLFDTRVTSAIFIGNALVVIFCQSLVSNWACSGSFRKPISLTFFLFSISFLIIGFVQNSYIALLFAIIIFSFAEIIIQIRLDYEATNVNQAMIATSFGIMSLASAFGGLFGSYFGTILYSMNLFGLSLWEVLGVFTSIIAFIYYIKPEKTSR